MTIPDPVRQQAESRPDAPALVTPTDVWTWRDLDARVGACAARLTEERVTVRADVSPALVVLVLACLRSGRTLVPLSTRWPTDAVRGAVERLELSAPLESDELEGLTRPGGHEPEAPASIGEEVRLRQPFTIVHTSGSTGTPKPVLHSVGNHVWSARGVVRALDLRADDRWLLDLPLYHVGGLGVVLRCALTGAALAVPEAGTATAEAVRQLAPTHASLVATQLRRLLRDAADAELASLRAVLLGGSAIATDLLDEASRRGLPVATSYGMTEMTSTVTATPPGADRATLGTSGSLLPYRALRIAEDGEIEVSGRTRFVGYATAVGFEPAPPWHPTGDLGDLDGYGHLVVTGRKDLQFVSGGENVQPETIEAALLRLPAVAEAVVVPVPDREFGARPVAFVRPSADHTLDADALAAALRQHVAGFMVPAAFHAWDGAGGLKPDRPALQAEAERRAAE